MPNNRQAARTQTDTVVTEQLMEDHCALRTAVRLLPMQDLHYVFVLMQWIVDGPHNAAVGIPADDVREFLLDCSADATDGPARAPNPTYSLMTRILAANVRDVFLHHLPIERLQGNELYLIRLLVSCLLSGPDNADAARSGDEVVHILTEGLSDILDILYRQREGTEASPVMIPQPRSSPPGTSRSITSFPRGSQSRSRSRSRRRD